jgi:hypothetical protein
MDGREQIGRFRAVLTLSGLLGLQHPEVIARAAALVDTLPGLSKKDHDAAEKTRYDDLSISDGARALLITRGVTKDNPILPLMHRSLQNWFSRVNTVRREAEDADVC